MNIEDNKPKTIFRNDYNGKALYSIGLSHKKQDGTWESGTMNCRFPKDAELQHKQKIKIVNAWLDFYVKDKITHPYIFINKYELVEEQKKEEIPTNVKTEYDSMDSDIKLTDEYIDETFDNKLELPF